MMAITFSSMSWTPHILRDAQKHPENYRDLVVRVAGFSAFFTKLAPGVQDEVIARTLQSFE